MESGKRKTLYIAGALTVAALVAVGLARALGGARRYETRFRAMSTDVRLVAVASGGAAARRMFEGARREIRAVDRLMSTYREDSEVSRLNREGRARISEPTRAVLQRAKEISRLTGGAFDATYAPLRRLWRRAVEQERLPRPEEMEKARAAVGYRKVTVKGGIARLEEPGTEIDLGGIAKGYAIDRAAEAMRRAGAGAGLVDVGGDLRLFGRPLKRAKWRIQVRTPPERPERLILELGPSAVATSGDYARGFRIGEQWFSHIIDPRTGRPADHSPSVTVVGPDATTADALATAFSVMEPKAAVAKADDLPDVECMIMLKKGEGAARLHSNGFRKLIGNP